MQQLGTQMDPDHANWKQFSNYEREIRQRTDPNILLAQLGTELSREWRNITNKTDYITALQDMQISIRETESLSRKTRTRQLMVEKARSASDMRQAHQDWEKALQLCVDGLRGLVESIKNFQHEQGLSNAIGGLAGHEKSRSHTADRLKTTRARISETQAQIDECRRWLKERGVVRSGDRRETGPEAQEEDGEGRGDRQRAPAKNSEEHREDGGLGGSYGVQHDALGGGTGAGGDPPGGGEGDRTHDFGEPASKANMNESDDDDEDDKEDGERTNEQAEVSQDGNYISLNDESLAGVGIQNGEDISDEDLLTLRGVLQQRRDISEQVVPRPQAPAQQTSQQPGADRERNHEAISHSQRRQSPRTQKTLHTIDGTPSDDPDDSSDDSDKNTRRPKDSLKSGSKRRASSKDSSGPDEGEDRKAKKRRSERSTVPSPEPAQDPKAAIAGLSNNAQAYYHCATTAELTVALDGKAIVKFVRWLDRFLKDDEWYSLRTIEEYFNEDGTERKEEPMLGLVRREFDHEWQPFFSKIPAANLGLTRTYEGLYGRLVEAEAWHVLPPGDAEELLDWFKRRVVEAEHPKMQRRWEDYKHAMERREGSTAGDAARDNWERELDRADQYGDNPASPPPIGPSGTPMPSDPLKRPDWLIKEARNLGFDQVDIRGVWTFLCTLHSGGQGHAALWVKYDGSGNVLDRKVVKESYLGEALWDDDQIWLPTADENQPREYVLGQRLASCQQSFNVIAASHFGLYPARHMYRLYMEYCRFGDLEDLIQSQKEFADSNPRDQNGSPINSDFPVSFLWCIFESLASAVCLMERGCLFEDTPPKGWEIIFHRDLKPRNVFLADADEKIWKSIAVPKLGDFGCAMEEKPQNCLSPAGESRGVGTEVYRAPEAHIYDKGLVVPFYPYSTAADIFAVGVTMLSLIHVRPGQDLTQCRYDMPESMPQPPDDAATSLYPQPLVDLVYECLEDKPTERISAENLCVEIQKHVGTCKSLKEPPLKFQSDLLNGEKLRYKPEPYRLWARHVV